MNPAKIAYLHLIRKKFSSLIVLLGIVLAVATSGILLRLYSLSNERFASLINTGDAIIGAKSGALDLLLGMLNFEGDYPESIPMNLYTTLKNQESLHFEDKATVNANFIRGVFPFALVAKTDEFRVYTTTSDFFAFKEKDLPELETGNAPSLAGQVVVGSQVASRLKLKVGDSLPARVWVGGEPAPENSQTLQVVGIFKATDKAWDRIVLGSWETADKIFNDNSLLFRTPWGTKVMNFMLVYLKEGGFPHLESLINRRTVAQMVSVGEGYRKLNELTGTGRELGLLVAAIIILLGFSSVASMMMGRFESMNVQLAVLRALGYSKSDLFKVLLYEALYLAVLACLLGALIDASVFPWLRSLLGANLPGEDIVSMPIWTSWPVWLAVIAGNIISVLYPIWRISKQNIHTSLRSI
ncbi:MAG: FtsX-like permease family protein [Bdellovibrionales bacterium]|nr:FtsX-like permease family protein [Bdellovibrionales bacterium]